MNKALFAALVLLLLAACQFPAQWLEPGPQTEAAHPLLGHGGLDEEELFRRQFLADHALQPETRLQFDPALGKIPARTVLNQLGLDLQAEQGCIACHPDKASHARQRLFENSDSRPPGPNP
ncbi:hypothetical protein [Geoalkalibacter halelectricus]|uniref:hypothetical protein n=1 Tax=Geoalkalibacter halelectricus TaxID=2847045 RepID=UPI003D1C2139